MTYNGKPGEIAGLGDPETPQLRQAQRMVAEELQRRGWEEKELASRGKNDREKLEVAAGLRRETTLSIKASAARVGLGTSKSPNAKLHRHMGRNVAPDPATVQP